MTRNLLVWGLPLVATSVVTVAQITANYRVNVLACGFAVLLTIAAYWVRVDGHEKQLNSRKRQPRNDRRDIRPRTHKRVALALGALTIVVTGICSAYPRHTSENRLQQVKSVAPSSEKNSQTAITNDANSPAIVGSGNVVTINSDSDGTSGSPATKKKHPRQ